MTKLTATQQTTGTLVLTDKKGNPAELDDVPQWSTSDANVVSVEPSTDGLSVVVKAGQTGTAIVTMNGDADLGEGVRPVVATEDFQVVAGEVVSASLEFEAPTEQP